MVTLDGLALGIKVEVDPRYADLAAAMERVADWAAYQIIPTRTGVYFVGRWGKHFDSRLTLGMNGSGECMEDTHPYLAGCVLDDGPRLYIQPTLGMDGVRE